MIVVVMLAAMIVPYIATLFQLVALIIESLRYSEKERLKTYDERHPRIAEMSDIYRKNGFINEIIMYGLCFLLEYVALDFMDVVWAADWTKQIYTYQLHQPISGESLPTVIAIIVIFLAGLTVLYVTDAVKTPPLVTALSIGALYIGFVYSIIWTIHIFSVAKNSFWLYFVLLPLNTFFITARLIIRKTHEYKPDPSRMSKIQSSRLLTFYNAFCDKAFFLPIAGLLLMFPILGVMIIILLLFGQAPDAAIKAFTETSDFYLSTKISPQGIYADQHYLCTVAAGGDRKIVKPLRRGIRHGHEVTVNRQLEVANAFEEVIQVRTPKFHKHIRHFYDTYGFPVAKLIKSNRVADFVYFLMKPLEYIFVIILYLTEVHPEDRIALQYSGTTLERFNREN